MHKFLDLVRRRVANVAIGASTARNMGSKGTIRRVRSFLAAGVLQDLDATSVETFPCYLDEVTNKLMAEAGVEWGPARKFLNIFLRDALYNYYIRAEYKL